MLQQHFEFIVGNPPWLSYRYIADQNYQDEVRYRTLTQYGLLPRDKRALFTQMELASVFLAHSLAAFGKENAQLAFVMPRALLTADQHAGLRQGSYRAAAPVVLERYWDMMHVTPLFNVPCCVLFARHGQAKWAGKSYTLPAVEFSGTLPQRNAAWEIASPNLTEKPRTGRLVFLGARNAFSTSVGAARPTKPSVYQKRFAQGATIVPRNLYFVEVPDLHKPAKPDFAYRANTDEDQARTAKKPWNDVRMNGRVEARFLFAVPLSKHLLPFVITQPGTAMLPFQRSSDSARMLDVKALRKEGWRDAASWMADAERFWVEKRPNSAKELSPGQWLDYQGKLTNQTFRKDDWAVLYNASGTNLSAAYVKANAFALPLAVDHKLYWYTTQSEDEAAYLVAILNSAFTNDAIKPFQSTGQQGERDIHKKPLELPIPLFDQDEPLHAELSELGQRATLEAASLVSLPDFPSNLAGRRRFVREHLIDVRKRINAATKHVLAGG
ncbi:MAG: hypothetical protein ABSH08_15500 [Tepidisphaeraceae bacterium]|jgi:hypothetical protein